MKSRRTVNLWSFSLWQVVLVILSVLILLIISFLIITILNNRQVASDNKTPNISKATPVKKPLEIIPGLPIRLKIPKINVDASIDFVGLTPSGEMDVKKDQDKVAWYTFGPRPGQEGNAVIAGHYGWFDGKASVFNDLHTMNPGDDLIVIDEKGKTNNFIVREIRKYNPKADASEVFSSKDGKAHLNLITCDGTWDSAKESYSNRLVIFADKKI